MSLRMRLTYPRPLSPMHDWLAVFVTRSGPFQGYKGQAWKLSLEKTKKARMMKEGQEASDWWSPSKQTEKRNHVPVELTETFGAWGLLAASAPPLQLVSRFNASFLRVLIQIMCRHKNVHTCWQTDTHRYTQQLLSLNLTCVFIKVSSCSIVLRRNGDWLWHNYTNPCMNLVLMEAEHLTQTKCRRADQCWGAFFSPLSLEQQPALCKTGHLHMQCISFKIITARWELLRLGTSQVVVPYRVLEMKMHVWKTLLWGKFT